MRAKNRKPNKNTQKTNHSPRTKKKYKLIQKAQQYSTLPPTHTYTTHSHTHILATWIDENHRERKHHISRYPLWEKLSLKSVTSTLSIVPASDPVSPQSTDQPPTHRIYQPFSRSEPLFIGDKLIWGLKELAHRGTGDKKKKETKTNG